MAPGPEDRQTIAQRVSAGFRPQKNIQPQQGRQNPDVELESSIARDCPIARLFSTETGAGTNCWGFEHILTRPNPSPAIAAFTAALKTSLQANLDSSPYSVPLHRMRVTRHARSGRDLNREFWKQTDQPEVRFLESEIWMQSFHGIITLHSDDTSHGLYGFVKGNVLSKHLIQPALLEAGRFLPRNHGARIDGFNAESGVIHDGYPGMLQSIPGMAHPPFEITLETPQLAPLHRQVNALVAALLTAGPVLAQAPSTNVATGGSTAPASAPAAIDAELVRQLLSRIEQLEKRDAARTNATSDEVTRKLQQRIAELEQKLGAIESGGKVLPEIAVSMAPKEKKPEPEKPKEPEKKPEPTPQPQRQPEPTVQPTTPPPATTQRATPPPSVTAPPAVAPPAVGLNSFSFSDGAKAVESTSDPVQLYRSFVEFSIRSKWLRPEGIPDDAFVAEVELNVDPSGRILGSTWRSGSGNSRWDDSVRRAVSATTALSRPPPKGFPDRFIVRFDVVTEADASGIATP